MEKFNRNIFLNGGGVDFGFYSQDNILGKGVQYKNNKVANTGIWKNGVLVRSKPIDDFYQNELP